MTKRTRLRPQVESLESLDLLSTVPGLESLAAPAVAHAVSVPLPILFSKPLRIVVAETGKFTPSRTEPSTLDFSWIRYVKIDGKRETAQITGTITDPDRANRDVNLTIQVAAGDILVSAYGGGDGPVIAYVEGGTGDYARTLHEYGEVRVLTSTISGRNSLDLRITAPLEP